MRSDRRPTYFFAPALLGLCLLACGSESADPTGSSSSTGTGGAPQHDAGLPPLTHFEDATDTLPGPSTTGQTMEARAADLDGDGDIDLVLAKEWSPNALLLNDGTGHFVDASDRIPQAIHDHEDIAIADLDGDGDLDIVISSEDDAAKELYLNDGTAHFEDASARLPQMGQSNAVVAADLDGDGDLDLAFGCAGTDSLLLNDGKGFFTDESALRLPASATTDVTQDVAAADIDGDGDLDLILGNEDANRVLVNDGTGYFTDETATRLPALPSHETRNADLGDVDGDGDLDLFFSNVAFIFGKNAQDRLLINDGTGHFTDETADRIPLKKRFTMDSDFVDIDGDGDLDLIQAFIPEQRYRILLNDGTGHYTDATTTLLPDTAVGEGVEVEVADFDGDGRLDLYLTGFMTPDRLLFGR